MVPHGKVLTMEGEEMGVVSTLDNLSALEDDDLISVDDGAETMGDDETGTTLADLVKGGLDLTFSLGVES